MTKSFSIFDSALAITASLNAVETSASAFGALRSGAQTGETPRRGG